MSEISRAQFRHWLKIPTRWGDLDALGHVNNAHFFTYDESARVDYFSRLMAGDARFWKEYGLILAHIGCDFVAQLHHPAEVEVGFRVCRLGTSSLTTEAGMFLGDKLVAVTRSVLVWFDYVRQKSLGIGAAERA
jgi:acyl-CoA thioester hydrolase